MSSAKVQAGTIFLLHTDGPISRQDFPLCTVASWFTIPLTVLRNRKNVLYFYIHIIQYQSKVTLTVSVSFDWCCMSVRTGTSKSEVMVLSHQRVDRPLWVGNELLSGEKFGYLVYLWGQTGVGDWEIGKDLVQDLQ